MIKKRLFSKQIKVNLTEEAHHRINALFVRRLLDKKTIGAPLPYKDKPKIIYRKVDPELLYEINKIGINLNQIAKRLNEENILELGRLVDIQNKINLLIKGKRSK
jgi:hypothetical protein